MNIDGMREDRVTTLRDGWTHASLDDANGGLEGVYPEYGISPPVTSSQSVIANE